MSTETPRDADGNKLCGWCGGPIQQKGVGRSRDYCTRTHKVLGLSALPVGRQHHVPGDGVGQRGAVLPTQ
ncbi:hypothetical protein ACFWED_33825, partial [Streptomyces anulatus]|uniref:hypothetical protein n=1 Tax=Streptomyces anulatus TaxID=1892 RepID=UPI00364EEC97